MGVMNEAGNYKTVRVKFEDQVCFIAIDRPESGNTINRILIDEIGSVLSQCDESAKVVVLEGSPEIFCFGADFRELSESLRNADQPGDDGADRLYELWLKLATGPYISVAHVRGKANAGGVGFVAACDVVISDTSAVFSLSELLFGLMPACVLPFLVRRVGFAKANYMTLTTQPVNAEKACDWGLVDACQDNSAELLRRQLLRFRRLPKRAVSRYKNYINNLRGDVAASKGEAVEANRDVFADRENLAGIARYVNTGKFPWE